MLASLVKKEMQFLVENAAGVIFDMDLNLIHLYYVVLLMLALPINFASFFVVKFVKQL